MNINTTTVDPNHKKDTSLHSKLKETKINLINAAVLCGCCLGKHYKQEPESTPNSTLHLRSNVLLHC